MRVIGSELQETDITHLLALRSASVRHAPPPAVPTDSALRLAANGYVRSSAGGVEITDQGLSYLEGWFLFCRAFGCDGVLRRWKLLSPMHAGKTQETHRSRASRLKGIIASRSPARSADAQPAIRTANTTIVLMPLYPSVAAGAVSDGSFLIWQDGPQAVPLSSAGYWCVAPPWRGALTTAHNDPA